MDNMAFNPVGGLTDSSVYPTAPATESEAREQIQDPSNQLRDFINEKLIAVINNGVNSPFYGQAIMNGNFDIWQRGISFNAQGYTADRWGYWNDGTVSSVISRQDFNPGQTDVPNNPKYFLRAAIASASGQSYHCIDQTIEDVRSFAGMSCTLSFWAKADTSRVLTVDASQKFGSGGSAAVSVTPSPSTFNLTTSWQKFTCVFTVPSVSGKTIGDNSNLDIAFRFPINTACTIDIAQVQLNAGSIALPFMPKSYGHELRDCRRFFHALSSASACWSKFGIGQSTSGTSANVMIQLPVKMRTRPSFSYSSVTDFGLTGPSGSNIELSSVAIDNSSSNDDYVVLTCGVASGLTQGDITFLQANNKITSLIRFDAEM